jgi:hypothetical protein
MLHGSISLVNEEVKRVIEDILKEKVEEELEFLPVVLKGKYWLDSKWEKEAV